MKHRIGFVHLTPKGRGFRDVAHDRFQVGILWEMAPLRFEDEDFHAPSGVEEHADEVTADEARAPGYERPQRHDRSSGLPDNNMSAIVTVDPRTLRCVRGFRPMMQFARVVDVYEKIEATTKRLEMTELLVGLLRETPKEDLDKVVYLTQGRIHPDYAGIELGLAEKMVIRVLAHATGLDDARVARLWKEKGDLGLVAQEAIAARRQKPLESTPLSVSKVHQHLDAIARESGEGSQERKVRLLSELLGNATPREAKYIVRMVIGQMRLGVADMTIVDALAATFATKADRARVERAYNVSSDLGEVARVLASKGIDGLNEIHLKLFRPIRAMLAERLETLEAIFERMGEAALEYKYDGLRVQAHVSPNKIELFSRHLENITVQFPEIVEGLRKAVRDRAVIVQAEAFFDEALQAGCEGLMAKALDSTYDAGARGYQWIKFKREYSAALSDTIDLVIVGAFAGRGKRAGSYGALLMAAYDDQEDLFRTTCKLGTGFDDETLFALPEKLKAVKRDRKPARVDSKLEPDVWFEPTTVLEVRGAELTVSPVHTAAWGAIRPGAGLAVRFPRFTGRWRDDKGPEDATTTKELLEMYRQQLKQTKKGTAALA